MGQVEIVAYYQQLVSFLEDNVGPLVHCKPISEATGKGWKIRMNDQLWYYPKVRYFLTIDDELTMTLVLLKWSK